MREQQWRQAFEQPEGWFCYVLARPDGSLIGFTNGRFRPEHEIPGELYVYVCSPDGASAYEPADRMVLARVPKHRIRERAAYEFFAGLDSVGRPKWSADIARREATFTHPGRCWRSSLSDNAGLGRYLWVQVLPGAEPRVRGGLGIYDAPEPWGPWTTVYFAEDWDVGPGESAGLPTKWMSNDGRSLHLVFAGQDSFSVRRATLIVPGGRASRAAASYRP